MAKAQDYVPSSNKSTPVAGTPMSTTTVPIVTKPEIPSASHPTNNQPKSDKTSLAPYITANVDKLRQMFDHFRETVLDSPHYAEQIAQNKSLGKIDPPTAGAKLDDHDQKLYEVVKSRPIDVELIGKATKIIPQDLQGIDTFRKFLLARENLIDAKDLTPIKNNDQTVIGKYLRDIIQQLSQDPSSRTLQPLSTR